MTSLLSGVFSPLYGTESKFQGGVDFLLVPLKRLISLNKKKDKEQGMAKEQFISLAARCLPSFTGL